MPKIISIKPLPYIKKIYDIEVNQNANYILANDMIAHNSGKGFARNKYIEGENFKIMDVDELKKSFLRLAQRTNEYPELSNINLKNPSDVAKLHAWVKSHDTKNKIISSLLVSATNPETLPNLLFDVTLKDFEEIERYENAFIAAGYKKENVHIVWVLQNYDMSIKLNAKRARTVPSDIVFNTHDSVARNMFNVLFKRQYPSFVDGSIYVVLNDVGQIENSPTAVKWIVNDKGNKVIDDFSYIQVKKPGSPIDLEKDLNIKLMRWFVDNIPAASKEKIFANNEIH